MTKSEAGAHVLVVDDDPRIRQMLTRYFEQEGYRVAAASDGAAMREYLAANGVDIILLDVVMPGDDGLTLAREIRARSDVGIIMLTGRDEMLDRVVGLEVGADDYIAKPFHLREVLARVKSVLRRRSPPPIRSRRIRRKTPTRSGSTAGFSTSAAVSSPRLEAPRFRSPPESSICSPRSPSSRGACSIAIR